MLLTSIIMMSRLIIHIPGRPPQATVDDLQDRFAELKRKFYPSRQRFTLPPKEGQRSGEALVPGKALADYGLADGDTLVFKDLGPQVCKRKLLGDAAQHTGRGAHPTPVAAHAGWPRQ
jgi:hypothetical protein